MIDNFLGPQVAIIDDIPAEVASIENVLRELNIGNKYFEVDGLEPNYPSEPIKTIEIVFLDLFYNTQIAAEFNPYACVDWLKHIIPHGKKYILIIWSKDIQHKDELLQIIKELDAPYPFYVENKLKDNYRTADHEYNIKKLLSELDVVLQKEIQISNEIYFGQIVSIEEDSLLINCLIHEESKTFELRRFDIDIFKKYIPIETGRFIEIKVKTTPGKREFEFNEIYKDLSEIFIKSDDFEDIGDVTFLNGD
jgi:hypothetical protein